LMTGAVWSIGVQDCLVIDFSSFVGMGR